MYTSTHSLTSALDGGEWSASRTGRFTPRERAPGTHWMGGWVCSEPFWKRWRREKFPALAGNRKNPDRPPVAQRYKINSITYSKVIMSRNNVRSDCICRCMRTFSTLPSYVKLQLWFLNTLQFSKLIPRQGTQVYPRSCSCLPAV
jgi:hypothetical protein